MSTDRLPPDHAVAVAPPPTEDAGGPSRPGRGRRIAFRVVSVLVALLFTVMVVFGLTELVFMWLPEDTVRSAVDDPSLMVDLHRSHYFAIGLNSLAIVATVWAQVRGPERRVGSMLLVLVIAVGTGVTYSLSGPLGGELVVDWLPLVVLLGLAALHPARSALVRRPALDRTMGALAAAAAVPWAVYIVSNAADQLGAAAGNPHAADEHYAAAALLGIVVIAAAGIGASDHAGRRLPAWLAAILSVLFGVHSLVFSGTEGAAPAVLAVGAIVWGIAFAAADVRRARTTEQLLAAPATS